MPRKASELDWDHEVTRNLRPHEWPEGVLEYVTAESVLLLSDLRTDTGHPMYPSPVEAGHVRHRARRPGPTNGDRHATDNGRRLSDAADFFVAWEDAPVYLRAIMRRAEVGGWGIYNGLMLRGTPGDFCMFHVDLRPEHVAWAGLGRDEYGRPAEYVSESAEPSAFYHAVASMLED